VSLSPPPSRNSRTYRKHATSISFTIIIKKMFQEPQQGNENELMHAKEDQQEEKVNE
jgi:hypothetical protein